MLSRRSFLGAGTLGAASIFVRPLGPVEYRFIQFHNQAVSSSLHRRLVEMWAAVRTETNGRIETEVFAENRGIQGSDPAALRMLVAGEVQFFTLMGGILGNVVPVAEAQQVPFMFRTAAQALKAMDGPLGTHVREEMATRGIYGFRVGTFDNGMRQIACATRPIVIPGDLAGLKMRVPDGEVFAETFRALGAEPIVINVNQIYDRLKAGTVAAQENPLAVVELFKLYEVVRYVSMTNHMWSGFNLMAHLGTWKRLPAGLRSVVERNAAKYVQAQRNDQRMLNARLRNGLAARGLVFNDVDEAPFRARLSGVYQTWRERIGSKAWSLLESAARA
jgi:tripartite ATP-independent transporter DctP family solute receptor